MSDVQNTSAQPLHPSLHLPIPPDARPWSDEEHVLAYYDGPLLLWLPHESKHLLAVTLDWENAWPCLVAEICPRDANLLNENKLSVRAAVIGALRHYHLEDLFADTPGLDLAPIALESIPRDWLPGDVTIRLD